MFNRQPMPPPSPIPVFRNLVTAGLEEVVGEFRNAVRIPQHIPQFFNQDGRSPCRGGIIHGLPGMGKNAVAAALLQESYLPPKFSFIQCTGDDILNGEWKINLHKVFDAGRVFAPSFVFIDEGDVLLKIGGDGSHSEISRLFLTLINQIDATDVVVIMVATNLPLETMDPALMRDERLSLVFELRSPDKTNRARIIEEITDLGGPNQLSGMTPAKVRYVVQRTEGYSRANLKAICNVAKDSALYRLNAGLRANPRVYLNLNTNVRVLLRDFTHALKKVKPVFK